MICVARFFCSRGPHWSSPIDLERRDSHPAAAGILLPTLWPQVRFCFLPLATVSCQCIASPILSSFFENAAVGSEPRRCSDGLLDKMRAFLRVLRTQGQERTTSRQQGPLSSLSQSDSQSSPSLPVTYSLSLDVCVCVHVYLHVYTLSCVHSGKSALPSRRQRPLSLSLSLSIALGTQGHIYMHMHMHIHMHARRQ